MKRCRFPLCRKLLAAVFLFASTAAFAADKITLGTDWRAEGEHGGYYEALATGLYAKAGLDVTIRQGGPQVNHNQLLAAGRIDFAEAPNSFIPLNFAAENIPMIAVAAMFQKDPAVLIAHPGQGNDNLAALKGKRIMISPDTRIGYWRFLRSKYGYSDSQIAPYTFNLTPFLADQAAIQQGYLTSEPFEIQRTGIKPVVMLLADSGYASYASVIVTARKTAHDNPDLVRRFVAATIAGWHAFLDGDPAPAYALIKRDNPDMSDALLAYCRDQLKQHAMVEAPGVPIGAMNDARWKAFFDVMSADGLYPASLDYRTAYSLDFLPADKPR